VDTIVFENKQSYISCAGAPVRVDPPVEGKAVNGFCLYRHMLSLTKKNTAGQASGFPGSVF